MAVAEVAAAVGSDEAEEGEDEEEEQEEEGEVRDARREAMGLLVPPRLPAQANERQPPRDDCVRSCVVEASDASNGDATPASRCILHPTDIRSAGAGFLR